MYVRSLILASNGKIVWVTSDGMHFTSTVFRPLLDYKKNRVIMLRNERQDAEMSQDHIIYKSSLDKNVCAEK